MLNDIENTGIKVKFICQSGGNSRGAWGEILEKSFADISKEEVEECDCIINTFMSLKNQVVYLYKKHKKYHKIISLYDIVTELYHYEKEVGYMLRIANLIARTGRKIYIFDYPKLSRQNIKTNREECLIKEENNVVRIRTLIQDEARRNEVEAVVMPALNKYREKYGYNLISYNEFCELYPTMSKKSNANIKYVGNSVRMYDMESPYVNIKNGMRVTAVPVFPDNNKEQKTIKLHFFGKSWVYGHHCADDFTIPSMVQKISNEKNLSFCVYNHGIPGIKEELLVNLMYEWNEKVPKDEVFILIHMFEDYGNQFNKKLIYESGYVNVLSSDRPHSYGEIWVDSGHIGEDGSELLARQVVDSITGNGKIVPGIFHNKFHSSAGRKIYKYKIEDQVSMWAGIPEFKEYQKYLSSYKQKVGAIVMNCNPFTLGHRYLIETASAQCEKLYIFVVEEDKSVFPFADRLKLVEQGVADLKNVTVLHSGNFIISALTFPGYFNKSVENDVSVDTSDDLTLFAKYIAPVLGITVRFAGEEPMDNITRQYNQAMAEILPKYRIEFIEIPRKMMGDSVISASRVRALLKKANFEEIKKIVPQTTFEYLKQNKEKYC